MSFELHVSNVRRLQGYAFRLAEPTALVGLDCAGADGFDAEAEARVRSAFWALCPEQRIYSFPGCADSDVPDVLLLDGEHEGRTDPPWRLGCWVVALTIALHRWAHVPAVRGRVIHADAGSVLLALPWVNEPMLTSALDLALRLLTTWADPDGDAGERAALEAEFRSGLENLHREAPALEWLRFVQAATARDLPFEMGLNHLRIGWAGNAVYLDATFTGDTSVLAHRLAKNKARTNAMLAAAGVPVPPLKTARSVERALQAASELGWPVVVKPLAEDLGRGVVTGIRTETELNQAFEKATEHGDTVVVEKHVDGDSYRLLVVHGRLLAVIRRVPAGVTGDGKHSIAELIEIANTDPRRLIHLKPVKLDDEGLAYIGDQGLHAHSVLQDGRHIAFDPLTRLRNGGSLENVWESVHPDNRELAERVAKVSRLDIAGVDVITTDISRSWRETGAVVCEVNSQPSLIPHWLAQPEREIQGEILDVLLSGRAVDIPTAAIIGAGSASAAILLHRIWTAAGTVAGTEAGTLAGLASTGGLLIGTHVIGTDDATDQSGERVLLNNPDVTSAVFELSAEKILESGHGCDRYGVAAVLSATGADTEAAASVAQMARDAVVLNADDPGCAAIRSRVRAPRQILLSAEPTAVQDHVRGGGAAVYPDTTDRRCVVIVEGATTVARLALGDAGSDLTAAMCAAALAWAQGIDPAAIADAL